MKPGSNDIHYGSLPRKLIISGPFRYSRHPIYLGMVCMCLGIAVVLGTISLFIVLVVEWFVFNFILIPPEERILTETLGERYVQYKSKVRSEEKKSELQSIMRLSYAVFGLKNKHK